MQLAVRLAAVAAAAAMVLTACSSGGSDTGTSPRGSSVSGDAQPPSDVGPRSESQTSSDTARRTDETTSESDDPAAPDAPTVSHTPTGSGTPTDTGMPANPGTPVGIAEPLLVEHPAPDGTGQTLHVFLQDDSYRALDLAELGADFTAATGATVVIQFASATFRPSPAGSGLAAWTADAPPDVVELDLTQIAQWAAQLAPLSASDYDNNDSWLPGPRQATTYGGDLLAVPLRTEVPVGFIRTDLAAAAGVDPADFATLSDVQRGAEALIETHGTDDDFSGLWWPPGVWQDGISFIWDHGGEIATGSDADGWTGALSTLESQAGVAALKDFYDAVTGTSTGASDASQALQSGSAGMVLAPSSWENILADSDNGGTDLTALLASFPLPSRHAGALLPSSVGGTALGVNSKSSQQELASYYIYLLTGNQYQDVIANAGFLGASTALHSLQDMTAGARAAAASRFVPNSARWADVEDADVLGQFFDEVLTGDVPIAEAARSADRRLEELLND